MMDAVFITYQQCLLDLDLESSFLAAAVQCFCCNLHGLALSGYLRKQPKCLDKIAQRLSYYVINYSTLYAERTDVYIR